MSRRPGIGANARTYWRSWRATAVWHGTEVSVPRYLHEAYKGNASDAELEALKREKEEWVATFDRPPEELKAMAAIALAKHSAKKERRTL